MFLTGFIFASVLVYLVCLEEELLSTSGNLGVALGTGFLFGLITMLVYYVGLFVTGLHTGLLIGVVILTILEHHLDLGGNMWIPVGILLGSALVLAVMTLTYQKAMTIVGTSIYGGAILAAALDYYVEKWRMVLWMWDHIKLKTSPQPCWFSWLLLGVWPFMVVVGTATQTFITGRGFYHKYQGESAQQLTVVGNHLYLCLACSFCVSFYAFDLLIIYISLHFQLIINQGRRSRRRSRKPLAANRRTPEADALTSASASGAAVVRPMSMCPGPRRYRYIYQVRTAHGDVISQRYIQALRKMVAVPHASKTATLQSAYALCSGESDTEGVGTWSTVGTSNEVNRQSSAGDYRQSN